MHKRNVHTTRLRFPLGDSTAIKPLLDKTNQIARYFEEAVPPHPSAIPSLLRAPIPVKWSFHSRLEKTFITAKLKHLSDQLHWSADYIFISFPVSVCFLSDLVTGSFSFPRANCHFPRKSSSFLISWNKFWINNAFFSFKYKHFGCN